MIQYIYQLGRFFNEAGKQAAIDGPALEASGGKCSREAAWHWRIVATAGVFAVLGAAAGVMFLVHPEAEFVEREGANAFLAPFMFGAGGAIFGVAAACVFAPRQFFEGPFGRKWLSLVGTDSITAARVVCAMLALLPVLVVGGLALMILLNP